MATKTEMDFVEVNGAQLRYEARGEGHPLVLLHGGLADMRMWDEHMESLSKRYRVIRFDLRGFGESIMPPGSFSFSTDIAGLLRTLGISRAYILGLSFGGKIALDFALEHPDMVDGIILVGSALDGYPLSRETTNKIEAIDARLESGDVEGAVELELQLWVDGPNRAPHEVDRTVRERIRVMNRHNYEVETDVGTPVWPAASAVERLHEIKIPTLIMVGVIDLPHVLQVADRLEADIPDARLVSIPGTAHHAPNEQPDEFVHHVLTFLDGLSV